MHARVWLMHRLMAGPEAAIMTQGQSCFPGLQCQLALQPPSARPLAPLIRLERPYSGYGALPLCTPSGRCAQLLHQRIRVSLPGLFTVQQDTQQQRFRQIGTAQGAQQGRPDFPATELPVQARRSIQIPGWWLRRDMQGDKAVRLYREAFGFMLPARTNTVTQTQAARQWRTFAGRVQPERLRCRCGQQQQYTAAPCGVSRVPCPCTHRDPR